MCLLVFVFLFPLYLRLIFLCSVTLWQPAVFYSVLVLYLRTHGILKPAYIIDCKHYNHTYCYFGNQFSALSDYIVSTYNEQNISLKMNGVQLVGWNNYCVHFCFNMLTFP